MREEVFCSFCRLPHKVYKQKHVPLIALVSFVFLGAGACYFIWDEFHIGGLLLFLVLTLGSEFLFISRWRTSVKCKACGFDPVVYKRNPEQAAESVKNYLEKRKQDPTFLLKPQPQLPQRRSVSPPSRSKDKSINA